MAWAKRLGGMTLDLRRGLVVVAWWWLPVLVALLAADEAVEVVLEKELSRDCGERHLREASKTRLSDESMLNG